METDVTPEALLADAERELKDVRAEMLQLALPMHAQMFPAHGDHSDLTGRDRENKIIGEVLQTNLGRPLHAAINCSKRSRIRPDGHHRLHPRKENRHAQHARQSESDPHAAVHARNLFRGGIPQRAAA